MTQPYNNDLTVLVQCLATTFGDEVGQAVQEKFDQLLALEGVDINALNSQIAALNAALASNAAGDQLTAQSILAQLGALDTRLDVLEGSTAVADLAAIVAGIQTALAAETQNRIDADSGLQSGINSIQAAVDSLTQQVVSIQNSSGGGGGSACDCAALTAAIAEQATAIANLTGVDAQQAAQIAALQTAIEGLTAQAAGIAAAQAAADAAAATAQTALANAATANAAASAAAAAAAAVAADVAALETANDAAHDTFVTKIEIQNINCALMGQHFRNAMRGRLFGLAGGNGGN